MNKKPEVSLWCMRSAWIVGLLTTLSVFGEVKFLGEDAWACRKSRIAVVNPVGRRPSRDVLSLGGEWSFIARTREQNSRRNSHDVLFFPDKVCWASADKIRVPGCWEAQDFGERGQSTPWDYHNDASPKMLNHASVVEGWYRRTVRIPADWAGRRIWLKIGGVNARGWFWVNRCQAAHVVSYCGTYKYDVTDCVRAGEEAELLVQVDTRAGSRKGEANHCHRWGGIMRDIELEATEDVFIDDAWVRGDYDRREAEVHVETGGVWKRGLAVRVEIEGEVAESSVGQPDAQTTLRVPLREFRPWSPEHPNLYWAEIDLLDGERVVATRRERFGVRKLEVRGNEFYLNDRPFFLRGFGDDSVYPITGFTPADRASHLRHLRLARRAGFNFVRLHTHCEIPEYFEAADEAGILVQVELPYINGDIPGDGSHFDPVGEVLELYRNFRRHPSFAVYANGNEGSFGPRLDAYLKEFVKSMDQDRLKLGMDSQFPKMNPPETADYEGGPVDVWPRGSINPSRPFVCHEYLNNTVKLDARLEGRFTGAWAPPVTRRSRLEFLGRFGLDEAWGDRLQVAQHALQAFWQRYGVEQARKDPYCDGYCFWTIVDVVVGQHGTYTAQGLFNPFWESKRGGLTAEKFGRFNSASAVLFDCDPLARTVRSGETREVDVLFSHYGETPLPGPTRFAWTLKDADGRLLASGETEVGAQAIGPARKVTSLRVEFPDVGKATKVVLTGTVGGLGENDAEFWVFPRRGLPDGSRLAASGTLYPALSRLYANVLPASDAGRAAVVVAETGSELISAAQARRQGVLVVGPVQRPELKGIELWGLGREIDPKVAKSFGTLPKSVALGWWSMGRQVGTALREHPAFAQLPQEGVLSPLLFGIVGFGRMLPFEGANPESLMMVAEGGDCCSAYLVETVKGRTVEAYGLDLLCGRPEATALLDGLVGYLDLKRREGRESQ